MPTPFAQPADAFAGGFSTGLGNTLQVAQVRQQRDQANFQRDMTLMEKGIELAKAKGVSGDTLAKVINNTFAPIWNRYHPKTPFPNVTGTNVSQYKDVIKNSYDLLSQANQGKITHQFAFQEGMKQWSEAVSNHSDTETETEKAARETSIAALEKTYGQSGSKAPTPQDAAKRMTELQQNIAKIDQADKVTLDLVAANPSLAGSIGKPIDPALKAQLIAAQSNEIKTLNPLLPEANQLKGITAGEYQKLKQAGHSDADIFGSNLYLSESLPAKQ